MKLRNNESQVVNKHIVYSRVHGDSSPNMDQNEGLRRWRVAQNELAAEEVKIRSQMQNIASSRRLVGLLQQSNAVHKGMRREEDNIQLVSRFYHVKPPPLVHVGNHYAPTYHANALTSMTHASVFSSEEIEMFKSDGNPSIPAEIALHEGVAAKYKARHIPDIQPYTGGAFVHPEPTKPSEKEAELLDAEDKAEQGIQVNLPPNIMVDQGTQAGESFIRGRRPPGGTKSIQTQTEGCLLYTSPSPRDS